MAFPSKVHGKMVVPRSYLYVPGNAPEKLAKARDRGAEALIIDLEDAVPGSGKEAARNAVVAWLRQTPPTVGPPIWVRINHGTLRLQDAIALACIPALTGLVLAKVQDAAEVAAVARLLDSLGDTQTLIMPLLETSAAVLDSREIASQPRVNQLQVGEVDLCADAGITPGPDEVELSWVRGMVVMASAAAGINPPVGPVSRLTNDADGLRRSTELVRRQGFVGRACIHPNQIPVVHGVFTPTVAEVEEARRVLSAFGIAGNAGAGVALDAAGQLIDAAVVRDAHRVLAMSVH